jgi:hypothetical protein
VFSGVEGYSFTAIPFAASRRRVLTMAYNKLSTDPEAVIYNALAKSVSVGVLNFEPEVLSDTEKADELEWLADRVLASLWCHGYQINRKGG